MSTQATPDSELPYTEVLRSEVPGSEVSGSEVIVTLAPAPVVGRRALRQLRAARQESGQEQGPVPSAPDPSAWHARLDAAVLESPLQGVILAAALAAALGLLARRRRPRRSEAQARLLLPTLLPPNPQREGYPCSTRSPS